MLSEKEQLANVTKMLEATIQWLLEEHPAVFEEWKKHLRWKEQ